MKPFTSNVIIGALLVVAVIGYILFFTKKNTPDKVCPICPATEITASKAFNYLVNNANVYYKGPIITLSKNILTIENGRLTSKQYNGDDSSVNMSNHTWLFDAKTKTFLHVASRLYLTVDANNNLLLTSSKEQASQLSRIFGGISLRDLCLQVTTTSPFQLDKCTGAPDELLFNPFTHVSSYISLDGVAWTPVKHLTL
jgi:hypothetical protein